MNAGIGALRIFEALQIARDRGASDAHFGDGLVPVLRVDGALVRTALIATTGAELVAFCNEVFEPSMRADLDAGGMCDGALRRPALGTLRLHAFTDRSGFRVAARLLPPQIPALESLDVPEAVETLACGRSGLVLVVGPAGSGKSTLLAAMLDRVNRTLARHIVTLEDPVEYVHQTERSIVAQCEIGRDVRDVAAGIRGILRADPDVIAIGELRDAESMRAALTAAETGHLVLTSLHTHDASGALDRIIDAFPVDGRAQIRIQLAQSLAGVIAIRLIRRARGAGRRAATEILLASDAVRNLIREGKTHQLRTVIQTGRATGMLTLESHLTELIARGEIEAADARAASERPHEIAVISKAQRL